MAEMPATNPDPIPSHGEDNVAEELLRVSGENLCRRHRSSSSSMFATLSLVVFSLVDVVG
jgi:hypothetical protein